MYAQSKSARKKEGAGRFSTTFNSESGEIRKIMSRLWRVVKADRVVGKDLPHNMQVSYRKSRSLKDELVQSYVKPREHITGLSEQKRFQVCGKCKTCRGSRNVKEYSTTFGKKCSINKNLSCASDFCVYVLQCPCGLKYVGSTVFVVRKSVLEHRRAIIHKDPHYPVARHFHKQHGGVSNLLSYFAIDRIEMSRRGGDREKRLRKLESRYILQMGPKQPLGLNKDEEMAVQRQ